MHHCPETRTEIANGDMASHNEKGIRLIDSERVSVLFIGGPSRGGSTLLDRMLGQIEGIAAVGELRYIWERGFMQRRYCGCGQPFWKCEFWQAVIRDALGQVKPEDGTRYFRLARSVDRPRYIPLMVSPWINPDFERRLREYQGLMLVLYRSIQKISGAELVVDSSKEPASAYMLSAIPEIRLHLVHLVRDSRGVAHSWMRHKLIRPGADPSLDESYMNRIGPVRSAWAWGYRNLAIELLGSRWAWWRQGADLACSYTLLRYEDLVRHPAHSLEKALSALGQENADLSFIQGKIVKLSATHTVFGNPMRFQHGPLELMLDEDWRRAMQPGHRRIVTAITLLWLMKYGYFRPPFERQREEG